MYLLTAKSYSFFSRQEFQNPLFVKFREEYTPHDAIRRDVLTSEGWKVSVLLLRIC